MYDKHIDTFIAAVETGSFSKAAERLYNSPSAVLQQINLLECDLGVKLLTRTSKGVKLTPAGEYFFREVKDLILRSEEIRRGLYAFQERQECCIRIGTNYFHTLRHFYEIWFHFHAQYPNYSTEIIPIGDISPAQLNDIDLIEGIFFRESWQKDYDFIASGRSPLCISVPLNHPLATRKLITLPQLADTPVVTIQSGLCEPMDQGSAFLEQNGIRMIPVNIYDPSAFMLCMTQQYGILIPEYWKDMNSQLVPVSIDWDYSCEYGFFVRKNASDSIEPLKELIGTFSQI